LNSLKMYNLMKGQLLSWLAFQVSEPLRYKFSVASRHDTKVTC
jgi:hypothetical protein